MELIGAQKANMDKLNSWSFKLENRVMKKV